MRSSYITNMTKGNPMRLLVSFTIPMLIGNLFQQLYNMVDSMIVGQFVSADALAAVGATGSITFLFFSLALGMSSGIGIIVSQYYGAGDLDNVQKTIANAFYVLGGSSILMGSIACIFSRSILTFMNTPDGIIHDSITYMTVSCAGLICVSAYNGVSSILRALGDSKTPLYFLILSSFVNIGLDLLFVLVFHWRVFGAAFATVISQLLAAIGCFVFAFYKIEFFRMPLSMWKPDLKILAKCIRVGSPVAFQMSLISISCIALQRVANGFKETVMSAYTAAGRFEQLVQQPFTSLGAAVATFTGQNIGAGELKRVKKGFRSAALLSLIFSIAMLPIAHFGGHFIMRLFVPDEDVIEIGAQAIKIVSYFYFALGMIYVSRNILNGAGDTMYAMVNGMVEVMGRVGFAGPLTSIPSIGMWGLWLTTGLTWLLTGSVSCIHYARGKWKEKSIVKQYE